MTPHVWLGPARLCGCVGAAAQTCICILRARYPAGLLSFPQLLFPTRLFPPAAAEQLGHTGRAGWGQIAAPAGLRTSRGEGPPLSPLPEDSSGHCWCPARSCFPSAQLWLLPESSTSSLQLPSPSAASPVCAEEPGKHQSLNCVFPLQGTNKESIIEFTWLAFHEIISKVSLALENLGGNPKHRGSDVTAGLLLQLAQSLSAA